MFDNSVAKWWPLCSARDELTLSCPHPQIEIGLQYTTNKYSEKKNVKIRVTQYAEMFSMVNSWYLQTRGRLLQHNAICMGISFCKCCVWYVNSSGPSGPNMDPRGKPSFVQIMAHHLLGVKLFSEQMLSKCQLDMFKRIEMKFGSKYDNFNTIECNCKCRLPNCDHFFSASMC